MAKKRKVKTVELQDYTPLEIHAIQIREYYLALRRAGFPADQALGVCTDRMGWPDWFVPDVPDFDPINPDHSPYEEDDDD